MKKILFLIMIMISVIGLAVKSDIVPPNPDGLFVNFERVGYSLGNAEISSAPLFDILGAFNIGFRYYINKNSVFNISGYFIDPSILPSYFSDEKENSELYFYSLSAYNHANFNIGKISFKSHAQGSFLGIKSNQDDNNFNISGLSLRGIGQAGYYVTDDFEIFGAAETGYLASIFVNPYPDDQDIDAFIKEAKEKSIYSSIRGGLRFFSGDIFGMEIGTRYTLLDSPLRLFQGYNTTDYIYNFFNLVSMISKLGNDEDPFKNVNIPFITTDYYLSFTVRF